MVTTTNWLLWVSHWFVLWDILRAILCVYWHVLHLLLSISLVRRIPVVGYDARNGGIGLRFKSIVSCARLPVAAEVVILDSDVYGMFSQVVTNGLLFRDCRAVGLGLS